MSTFLAWWLGQLADLLPAWLRRSATTSADALVITPGEPLDAIRTVTIGSRRSGEETPLGSFALDEAELGALPMPASLPAVLRLSRTDVLEKALSLPLAAQASLDQALAFEMDRETPFTADEVYWNHGVEAIDRQHGQIAVRLLVMPKARLGPLLAHLAQAGIVPHWAEIADGPAACRYVPLDGDRGQPFSPSRRLLWPAAVCCAGLALGAVLTPFIRQSVVLARLDHRLAAGQATAGQAEKLRREIDRLSGSAELVKNELAKAGRPLEVLAAVTRLLPADTYLTELELRQRKLTISGRSTGAARLIGALASDDKFRNPAFAAPVTRLEALHTEVFTIVADMGPSL